MSNTTSAFRLAWSQLPGTRTERRAGLLRCFIVAAAVSTSVVPTAAETPRLGYVGIWASSAAACHANPNATQDIAIRFTERAVLGHEWSCQIGDLEAVAGGWKARLSCSVEGTPFVRHVRWHLNEDGSLRETENGTTDTYVRCKDSDFRVGR